MPPSRGAAAVVDELRRVLEDRERRAKSVHEARVVGRNTDGTIQLQRLDGECIARGCQTGEYEGQVVKTVRTWCAQDGGSSGVAQVSRRGTSRLLWIESLDPNYYQSGGAYTVTVTGYGFTQSTTLEFLLPGSDEINEDITVVEIRYVSAVELEVDITVATSALAIAADTGDVAYDNPGSAL